MSARHWRSPRRRTATGALAAAVAIALDVLPPAEAQEVKPDLAITSVWPGPASENRFCIGGSNRLYVTIERRGGAAFTGPISVWLTATSLTGPLPAGQMQRIEYVRGARSWLVIFRDVPIAAEWRRNDGALTVVVNPEVEGHRTIAESNYNNNAYTLHIADHTDWGRKCQ